MVAISTPWGCPRVLAQAWRHLAMAAPGLRWVPEPKPPSWRRSPMELGGDPAGCSGAHGHLQPRAKPHIRERRAVSVWAGLFAPSPRRPAPKCGALSQRTGGADLHSTTLRWAGHVGPGFTGALWALGYPRH